MMMNCVLLKAFFLASIVCTCVRLESAASSASAATATATSGSEESGQLKQKVASPGVFETIKEMENYFDKMYIIEHLRSNMHTKLDVLNQVKAQLIAAQSLALNEKEKAKFGALVDSMTKTYKLLDIILVDFLPTEQDLLEIVEENSHLFGNHDFKAPSGGMPDLEKNENDDDDDDHSEAFNNNKKRFLQTHTAEKKSSKRYYSWLKNSQNYNMIPVIRTGK